VLSLQGACHQGLQSRWRADTGADRRQECGHGLQGQHWWRRLPQELLHVHDGANGQSLGRPVEQEPVLGFFFRIAEVIGASVGAMRRWRTQVSQACQDPSALTVPS
jgi:hypothetical protein